MLTVPDLVHKIARYYPGEDSHQLSQRIRRWASPTRFSDPIPSVRAPGGRNAALLFEEADWEAWWLRHRESVTGWRWVPLVIRDQGLTRAEVDMVMVDGVSRWLVADATGMSIAQWRAGWEIVPAPDIPGTIWRALNADGSPFVVEVEP